LALLRSGAFRMPDEKKDRQSDVRAGIRTLSPPSIVSAVVRCSHRTYDDWPVSALGRARSPLEQAIDECLHGKRPPDAARALALTGPEADCEPRYAEVYALTLASSFAQPQWFGSDHARPRSVSELRLRCHSALKRLDELEVEHPNALARVHTLQMRAQVERALSMLPSPEALTSQKPPDPAPAPPPPPANDTGPRQVVAAAAPAPQPTAAAHAPHKRLDANESSLLTAAEPLLQQGRWGELRELIQARGGDPAHLPAVLALMYAIALKEDSTASPDRAKKAGHNPDALGMRVISQLLSLPEQSPTVVLIAKRLMRRRPLDWKQKPPGRISAILVMSALLAGALVGVLLHPWLLALLWK